MCHLSKAILIKMVMLIQLQYVQAQMEGVSSFEKRKQLAIEELRKYSSPDTNRVNALLKILNTAVFLKERKEVIAYLPEAMQISRTLHYDNGLGNCYLQKAGYYKSASDYQKALICFDSVLFFAEKISGESCRRLKQLALQQKAAIFHTQENYYTALDFYFESLKYVRPDDFQRQIRLYSFITDIYTQLNNFEKADEFAKKNVALVELDTAIDNQTTVYLSYIDVCLAKNDLLTASAYLEKLRRFIPDPAQVQVTFGYYLKSGRINFLQQKYADAYEYFKEGYRYALTGGHINSKNISLYFLSRTALQLGLNEEAKRYAADNLALAETMNTKSARIDALANLSAYFYRNGNKGKAYELLQRSVLLKDSFMQENNLKQLNVLGVMYKYGKQQEEIGRLENEKEKQVDFVRQKSLLNNVYGGSIIALLFVGYLGYINFRKGQKLSQQQQALQHQKIIELEKDRQLFTVEAMLKGQEEERSRIAKDLHDGLGSLLSGTKLSFMNVKEKLALSGDSKVLFERSLSMLDNTIGDLRKVAQNLMPEALVKFGLHEALRDFCDTIQLSSGIKVLYQQFGEKRILENTAEVFIYRIIQELVNNAVKHAGATTIMVQLAISKDKTGITVEDDGKGFDRTLVSQKKGSGQANINYRVQYFNGSYDIVTSPENGTSVNIQLTA